MLTIHDRIYGKIKIDDPLVEEIVNTPTFQRLKRINQFGGVNLIFPEYQVSRFDHSVGVWWILKKLNTSKEIQLTGLLHDIAHSPFSHMLDMAKEDKDEGFHERVVTKFGLMEPINKLLKKNHIRLSDPNDVFEIKMSLPDVGADRIDYAIRDYYGAINKASLFGKKVISQLVVNNGRIHFTNKAVAKRYALTGLKAMWKVIYDPKVDAVYQSIIEIFRLGLKNGWITEEDLTKDDEHMLNIFMKNKKGVPSIYTRIFEEPYKASIVDESQKHDFFHIKLKVRYFDPTIFTEKGTYRLSQLDESFNKVLTEKTKIFEGRKKGVYIKVDFLNKTNKLK